MTPDNEVWKPIPNFPGYEASDQGRLRSYLKRTGAHTWVIARQAQRVLKGSHAVSYKTVCLCQDGDVSRHKIHRLILSTFVGPKPLGMEAMHRNGNPHDNRLCNLKYGTHAENMRQRTIESYGAKLTERCVRAIRALYASGKLSQYQLAQKFGVSANAVGAVVRGETWKHVADPHTEEAS